MAYAQNNLTKPWEWAYAQNNYKIICHAIFAAAREKQKQKQKHSIAPPTTLPSISINST